MVNNLRFLREQQGLTAKALAQTLNVTAQAVGKWERGEAMPQAALLPALADALNCTIDALFGRGAAS